MVALPCHLICQRTRPAYAGAWRPNPNDGRNCHKNCHRNHGHGGNQTGWLISPLCLPIPPPGPNAQNVTQRKDLRKQALFLDFTPASFLSALVQHAVRPRDGAATGSERAPLQVKNGAAYRDDPANRG